MSKIFFDFLDSNDRGWNIMWYAGSCIASNQINYMFKVYTTLFLTALKTFKSKRFASTRHGCEFGLLPERAGYIEVVDLILDLPTQRWRLTLLHLSTLNSVSFLFFSNACLNREMLTFESTKVICYFLLGFGQFCPVGFLKALQQQQHCGSSSSSALFSTNGSSFWYGCNLYVVRRTSLPCRMLIRKLEKASMARFTKGRLSTFNFLVARALSNPVSLDREGSHNKNLFYTKYSFA